MCASWPGWEGHQSSFYTPETETKSRSNSETKTKNPLPSWHPAPRRVVSPSGDTSPPAPGPRLPPSLGPGDTLTPKDAFAKTLCSTGPASCTLLLGLQAVGEGGGWGKDGRVREEVLLWSGGGVGLALGQQGAARDHLPFTFCQVARCLFPGLSRTASLAGVS